MAHYTKLTPNDLNSLAQSYGLGLLTYAEVMDGGSENTNYLLKTAAEAYVLTICEQKSPQESQQLADLLQHLQDHRFNSSRVIPDQKGNAILLLHGKPVMLKMYLRGKVLQRLSLPLVRLTGRELGRLHQIPPPAYLPRQLSYGHQNFPEVEAYAPGSPFAGWLRDVSDYITPYLTQGLPRSLIHSDVFSTNVIISEDESAVTIMDFEEATYYYRVFDLGMTITGICLTSGQPDLDKARELVTTYRQEIEMTTGEIEALQAFTVYATAAMTFWRHRQFNHLNPDPALKDHYRKLQAVADYVWKQPADVFLS